MTEAAPTTSKFVSIETHGRHVFATPTGPTIGEREASIINEEVSAALDGMGERLRFLVLDMHKVEFMPSIGVGMCVDLHNRAKALGGRAAVTGLNQHLQQLFQLMKLNRIFDVVSSDEQLQKLLARK